MPPSTVDISKGQQRSGRQVDRQQALSRVYQDALAAGLGEEGARAAVAIAQTEGGFNGDVGDLSGGGSFGTFQFYAQGQLPNFAAANKMTVAQAKALLRSDPMAGNRWALSGYLGNAIKVGMQKGLRGPALATHAQRTGQVSESPERAGANYQAIWSTNQPAITGGSTVSEAPATTPQASARGNVAGYTRLRDKYKTDNDEARTALAEAEKAVDAAVKANGYAPTALLSRVKSLESKVKQTSGQLERAERDLAKAEAAGGKPVKPDKGETPPNLRFVKDADGKVWGINPRTGEKVDVGLGAAAAADGVTGNQADVSARGWAALEVSKQNAATSWAREQILEGRLDFDRGKEFLDRVDATSGTVKVGDKWYIGGFEPGGAGEQLARSIGYKFTPREANIVDVAAALGDPSLNRTALAGPYAQQLNQYGVKTGLEAPEKTPGIASAPAAGAPEDQIPIGPNYGRGMAGLSTGGSTDEPTPMAGQPGGPTQAQVQSNERPPLIQPRRDLGTMYPGAAGPNAIVPPAARPGESPLAADYRGPDPNAAALASGPPPGGTVTTTPAMIAHAARFGDTAPWPPAAPAPDFPPAAPAPPGIGADPIGGPSFGDRRLQQAIAVVKTVAAQSGYPISDEEALRDAQRYLSLQGE